MLEFFKAVLVQLGGMVVVAAAVAKWLVQRAEKDIDRRLQDRQAERLEALRKEHQKELQVLRDAEARLSAQFASLMTVHGAMHNATVERRVRAIDNLWQSIIRLQKTFPAGIAILDVLTSEEYASARGSAQVEAALRGVTHDSIRDNLLAEDLAAEPLRPFLPEILWQYFFAYRAFLGRIAVNCITPKTRLVPWYEDAPTCRLLRSILPQDECDAILAMRLGRLTAAQDAIQLGALREIRRVLSGESASQEAVSRIRSAHQAIVEANAETAAALK